VTLVWIGLVVALLVMLAVFAVVLARKAFGVLQAFSDLVGRTAILDGVHRAEAEPRTLAVLGGVAAASTRWREARHRSREIRTERRSRRLTRGTDLVTADASLIRRFQR
jgi:hypothetical protein